MRDPSFNSVHLIVIQRPSSGVINCLVTKAVSPIIFLDFVILVIVESGASFHPDLLLIVMKNGLPD